MNAEITLKNNENLKTLTTRSNLNMVLTSANVNQIKFHINPMNK
jgi:hypothetical protein